MSAAHEGDCRGDSVSGNWARLVKRIRSFVATGFRCSGKRIELAFCEDAQAGNRIRQQAAYPPDHCLSGEPEFSLGIEHTAEFVRSGAERLVRWSVVVLLLVLSAWGFAEFCHGVESVEARRTERVRLMPEIGPLPAIPPIESGGCLVSVGGTSIVTRVQ